MIEQLIITLREGIEAALMVAIAITYLRRIGRTDLFRVVYAALLAAFGLSLAGAILMTRLQWNEDRFEGWMLLIAGVFVFTMVYWMSKAARHLHAEIEQRLGTLTRQDASATGVFLFVFFMVLREGVETVLMLTSVSLNTSELLAWLGSVIGLALAILFGVAFVKGTIKIDLRRFFRITNVILWFIATQLLITGLHELSEAGVLPSSRAEMAYVGPLVRNDVFFFVVVLGLAGIMILRDRRASRAAAAAAAASQTSGRSDAQGSEGLSGARRRAALAAARRDKIWSSLAYIAAFVFLIMIAGDYVYARSLRALSPAIQLTAHSGMVAVPASQIEDGNLHRYKVITPQGAVRFFAMRKPNGRLALAFDACQICGGEGYYQHGNMLFCRNCDAPINISSLGIWGGCNPIPLQYQATGKMVLIKLGALAPEAPLFAKAH